MTEPTHKSELNASQEQALNYDAYAPQFDDMVSLLPAYAENIQLLLNWIPQLELPPKPRVCDVGAGTGNFIIALDRIIESGGYTHLDANPLMVEAARQKYRKEGVTNVNFIEEYVQRVELEAHQFDLIICVNTLNTAPPQDLTLTRIRNWLKPGAPLFLINFSRETNVIDWGWYLMKNTIKNFGVARYIKALANNRQALIQNLRGKSAQRSGNMATHTTEDFVALVKSTGFKIEHFQTCYRGYCDLVIARA